MLVLFPMQEQCDDSSEDEAAGDVDSTWTHRHGIYNFCIFIFTLTLLLTSSDWAGSQLYIFLLLVWPLCQPSSIMYFLVAKSQDILYYLWLNSVSVLCIFLLMQWLYWDMFYQTRSCLLTWLNVSISAFIWFSLCSHQWISCATSSPARWASVQLLRKSWMSWLWMEWHDT